MKYSRFKYSDGVLYGYGLNLTSIAPDSGPSTGGDEFVCVGTGFEYTTFDDTFTGVTLDLVKWTDISSGTGSVTTGSSNLQLSTGATASSMAGILMNNTFYETQYEIKVNIPTPTANPTSAVSLINFEHYVDANNYGRMYVSLSAAGAITLDCLVHKGGVDVDSYSESWTVGVSTFKVLVWREYLYFYANGALFFKTKHFDNGALGSFRVYAYNDSASYNVYNTVVEYIINRPFVVFGDTQVVNDAIFVSNTRIRGITPPSTDDFGTEAAYAGLVDINVVINDVQTLPSAYEYVYLKKLVLISEDQFDLTFSDITEDTVRTPELSTKGLGGGK
ncbi:hypothetical protein N8Z24_00510 [bacterium]|nr:hypothetical protein [bacterium]